MTSLTSCKSTSNDTDELQVSVIKGYSEIVYATYSDALQLSLELQNAIDSFIAGPSEDKLIVAKKAWIAAREVYGRSEVFRFYDGPVDNGSTGVEGLLNAWPLDEVYVDYVSGQQDAGIINNRTDYPVISKELLVSLNENGGEENISAGYHAIEFLLWGQDLDASGAGKRPYTDYLRETKNADRRILYLRSAVALLIENLSYVKLQWEPGNPDNYRSAFENSAPEIALQKIITGMGVLSKVEMAGERMFTAYDNADQEDEQSCFSDNTKADLINNLGGIINVFYGTYLKADKSTLEVAGIGELIKAKDDVLYAETEAKLKKCMDDLQHIYNPFDQALVLENKRPQVMTAILSVQQLGDQFAKVAGVLGLSININAVD